MKLRQGWVALAGVALAMASACSDDGGSAVPAKTNDAGAGGEGATTQAGTHNTAGGSGGAPVSPTGGMPGEVGGVGGEGGGVLAGAGGEGGMPVVVSKDINGSIYGLSDELVILIDGVNVPIDADGHFRVPNAPDEYQLQVCAPNYKLVDIYDGLRTRTPLVDYNTGLGEPPYAATIRGKVTGGLSTPFTVANDETVFTEVAYSSKAHGYLGPRPRIDPPEGFDLNPKWFDSATDTGEVLALQYVFKSKVGVTQFTGFGRRAMTIADGNIYGSVNGSATTDLLFTAPAVSTITGHLGLPSGWTRSSSQVHVGPFTPDSIFEGDFSLLVPQLDGVPMWVLIQAKGPEGNAELKLPVATQSPWNINVPSPPKQLLPVDKANAVTHATTFTWSNLPKGTVASVVWLIGDWTIERYTTDASTTIPDLSAFGVTLPAATESGWRVRAVGPAATTDDVLVAQHKQWLDVPDEGVFLGGPVRNFTTAP
jgi:hypothetical protein